jgi:hypothetical protein
MADQFLTLGDLTALEHGDASVGVVNIVRQVAPEFDVISGRPIKGTHARISRIKELPGGNTASDMFRGVGEGVATQAPTIEQILVEAYYIDQQIEVDEALVKGQPGDSPADILALHTSLQVRKSAINLGRQFYKGTDLSAKGFYGLEALVDSSMSAVKGSATGSTCESVWLVRNSLDGVHFVFGNGVGLQLGAWMRQRVTKSSKHYFAHVNNYSGYIGLANNHPLSIARIANLDNSGTSGKYVTDKMIAQALSLFPVGFGPTHLFMSRHQRYWLQQSRSVVTPANLTAATPLVFAPTPQESNGIAITVTDSITLDEDAI